MHVLGPSPHTRLEANLDLLPPFQRLVGSESKGDLTLPRADSLQISAPRGPLEFVGAAVPMESWDMSWGPFHPEKEDGGQVSVQGFKRNESTERLVFILWLEAKNAPSGSGQTQ